MSFTWHEFALIAFAIDWIIKLGLLVYVPRNRKPSAAIAWLLVIFIIPWIGILLFLLIGSPKLSRHRRNMQNKIDKLIDEVTHSVNNELNDLPKETQTKVKSTAELTKSLGKLPVRGGNTVKILPEYDDAIADIVAEINKAEEFVHIEYFIIALDKTTQPLFDALEQAMKRGVKVRVLLDGLGYRAYPGRRAMKKFLTSISVEWYFMLPPSIIPKHYNRPDLRNHRKIVVIDDRLAYIGSQNLVDRTYHRKDDIYYDELVAKLTGPVVRQCNVIFASDWYAETNELLRKLISPAKRPMPTATGTVHAQMLPSGPNYETENNAQLYTHLFHIAEKRIFITNPYFVPNEAMLEAIKSAAKRGVEVIMLNSKVMDQWMVGHAQRSYYPELIEAGVQIYLYNAPILLHSKHLTIDDEIAVIGSSNMDIRSFELDLECLLVTYDKSVVKDLNKVQVRDLKRSTKIDLSKWSKRSLFNKFLDSASRLTAALQ